MWTDNRSWVDLLRINQDIFRDTKCSDQSYTSKNIWWLINSSIHTLEISTLTDRYNSLGFKFKPHLCDFTSRSSAQGSPLICMLPVIPDDFECPLKIVFTVKQLTRPFVCFVPKDYVLNATSFVNKNPIQNYKKNSWQFHVELIMI